MVAVLTFFAGLERVGPVVAVLLGAFVLGERLSVLQGVGGLLILTAVVLLARPDKATHPSRSASEGG